jgi:hypothetical protein
LGPREKQKQSLQVGSFLFYFQWRLVALTFDCKAPFGSHK